MDGTDHLLHVATAGWNVPRELAQHTARQGTALQRYAGLLGAAEINSTFYRRHRAGTFARWHDSVPDGFRFAVKMPRAITHEAALASPRAELSAFFSDLQPLGKKLGPILVQLPASVHFEARRVRAFFRVLRSLHSGPVACEPRHASWYGRTAERIFIEYEVARVLADPPRPDAAAEPGGWRRLLYVRWHGSPRIYWSSYGPERLGALALFVQQQPPATNVWCVFDNTASGAALHDALHFSERCAGSAAERALSVAVSDDQGQ